MSFQYLQLEQRDQVATVWINRAEMHNAFNTQVIEELHRCFSELNTRDDVRVVILAGRGKSFSAGADLNWMKEAGQASQAENEADALKLAKMLQSLATLKQPTIARVQGIAFGGGMGLASACDICVASSDAKFATSEVRLGLAPSTISPYVIRALGARASQRYFLSAEVFDAKKARQLGFIHERVSEESLNDTVAALCAKMVNNSPNAVKTCKRLLHKVAGAPITDELVADTVKGIADIRSSAQGKEGVQAFLHKRKPDWLTTD